MIFHDDEEPRLPVTCIHNSYVGCCSACDYEASAARDRRMASVGLALLALVGFVVFALFNCAGCDGVGPVVILPDGGPDAGAAPACAIPEGVDVVITACGDSKTMFACALKPSQYALHPPTDAGTIATPCVFSPAAPDELCLAVCP